MKTRILKAMIYIFAAILVAFFWVGVLSVFTTPAQAKHKHTEKYYQNIWCAEQGGETEVVMPNGTRCDCLTDTHAVEHDFAAKWCEAVGQSLHYSAHTGKRAGIVLIMESDKDVKYWERLNWTIKKFNLPIDTWAMH